MKVILHVITGLDDGGAEAVLYRLCKHTHEDRHHVVSLTGLGKYGPLLEAEGVSVMALGMPRGRVALSGLFALWRHVRKVRPDIVQTWMYHADLLGGVIARLAGQRAVCWGVHNTDLVQGISSRGTIVVSRICALISRVVPERIICCAERSREFHASIGYDKGRMTVVPNGYDLSVFFPDNAAGEKVRRDVGLEKGRPTIGFVARFDPQKDHSNLLQALALLKKSGTAPVCLLVGSEMDPTNENLVQQISQLELDDQIRLLGRRSDVPAIMNALDLHVMSSSFGEAFPNVLAEAMACGTPCISTDVGDAALILGDTGWIVPTRNPEALAAAIFKALEARGGSSWLERRAEVRRRVEQSFSIDRMSEGYRVAWHHAIHLRLEQL